jgi:hypothetical protein
VLLILPGIYSEHRLYDDDAAARVLRRAPLGPRWRRRAKRSRTSGSASSAC